MDSIDDESANDVNNDNGAEGLHQFYYQYLNYRKLVYISFLK
jgi:hypothetical protein